jgi:hypothetical protein
MRRSDFVLKLQVGGHAPIAEPAASMQQLQQSFSGRGHAPVAAVFDRKNTAVGAHSGDVK